MESKIEVIKQTFLAGESMNVNNFVKFFTEDCRYKFGNFPETRGPHNDEWDSPLTTLLRLNRR